MKPFLITIGLALLAFIVPAQEAANKNEYTYFIVIYSLGENWDTTKQAHQQSFFKEHSLHLAELRKTKKIDVGGRYSDKGMILLKAKNKEEAFSIITNDIAIQNKIFKAELFPFEPFYKGCIE